MTKSIRRLYLWGTLIFTIASIGIAWSASAQGMAHLPMSEGETVSTIVSPGVAATLTSPDGRVTITFPTDFFTQTLVVTYTEKAITNLPARLVQIGPAFTLEVALVTGESVIISELGSCPEANGGAIDKTVCQSSSGGLEIAFNYLSNEVASANLNASDLAIAYFYSTDGIVGKWEPLITVVDETQQRAYASTWYAAHFALLGITPPAAPESTQSEIIVDDMDTGFIRFHCDGCEDYWWHYWSDGGTYADHSYYTKSSDLAHGRENWAEWTPHLPQAGLYEIFAFIPWQHATITDAHYHISVDGVQIDMTTINQLNIYADWVSLGSYNFPSGMQARVMLDDSTDNLKYAARDIGFDALKFVCVDCDVTPTPTPTPAPTAFRIDSVAVVDANGNELTWDDLVTADDMLFIEAEGTGDNPPDLVWSQVKALQSGKGSGIGLGYVETVGQTHIYRGARSAHDLVVKPGALMVAAVVYEEDEFDYEVAQTFMDDLEIPDIRQMGIAWGETGAQARNRPPANIDYFKAAGYETAQVIISGYGEEKTDEFFIQNQADIFLYLGHGLHDSNSLFLYGGTNGSPSEVGNAWNQNVKTVVFLGCSVLDINDYNNWWAGDSHTVSPGKAWKNDVPGPNVWLGFQHKAPTVGPPQDGETSIYALASEYLKGKTWVEAWKRATGNDTNITSSKSVGGVAIDSQTCNYYYWKEHCPPIIGCRHYTWEVVSCEDWNSSGQGIEALVVGAVEVHLYDEQGQHVGPDGMGGVDTEIPGSAYWMPLLAEQTGTEAHRAAIRSADLSHDYQLRLRGTGDGTIDFSIELPDRATGQLYQTSYLSVPVTSGDELALTLVRGTDFILAVDRNGDGVFEDSVSPDIVITHAVDVPVNLTLTGTSGAQGWYTSDIVATLQTSSRPDLPQIAAISYTLGSGWQPYTVPLTFNTEATHTLRYRGTFEDGTQDAEQWIALKLDKTAPTITLTSPMAITYTLCPYSGTAYTGTFDVVYEAVDDVSGIDAVTAVLAGNVLTNGQTLDTLFLPPGPHELAIKARNHAGLQTTHKAPLFVETHIEDLLCATTRLRSMELITGPSADAVVADLLTTLGNAQTARDSGDIALSVDYLHTFVQAVENQYANPISYTAAQILIRGAQYTTNRLAGEIAVTSSFGGVLTAPDFHTTITFPAMAVETLVIVTYQTLTTTPPITLTQLGEVFDLSAREYITGTSVSSFSRPVTITIQYGNGEVTGIGESWLALHYWDAGTQAWRMLPTTIDKAQDRAWAEVDHFTLYALLEREYITVFLPLVARTH